LQGWANAIQQLIDSGSQVNPEYIINVDAGLIIIFQVLVSWAIARLKPFSVMIMGTVLLSVGFILTAFMHSGWPLIFAIMFIAFGEMMASPKSQEYTGKIAPKEKKALYMGYYFICIALGNLAGGILSGQFYGHYARDLQRPDIMWKLFGAMGIVTAIILFAYNAFILVPSEKRAGNSKAI